MKGKEGAVRASSFFTPVLDEVSGTYPEIEPNQVRVFLTETDVEAPFDKIALITASGSTNLTGEVELIRAMRKEAASLGANGLILGEIREPPLAAEIAGDLLGFDLDRRRRAVAIRIPHPGNTVAAGATADVVAREASAGVGRGDLRAESDVRQGLSLFRG